MVDHGSMGSTNYACETSVNNVFYGGGYNLDRLSGEAPSRPDGQNNEHECAIPTYAVTGPPNRKCRIVARSNGSIEKHRRPAVSVNSVGPGHGMVRARDNNEVSMHQRSERDADTQG
jgi:hypothetical protein